MSKERPPEKEVVERREALAVPPVSPVRERKKVYTFLKTMSPDQEVKAGDVVVKFIRPLGRGGQRAQAGTFRTDDAELAHNLRQAAASNPSLYVFETTKD